MRQLLQVAAVSLALAASGCITVGDAVLRIKGRLVIPEAPALKCNLELSPVGEKVPEPRAYYVRPIEAEFSANFTVEPAVREYRVAIVCPGYETVERIVRSTRSEARIELGSITPAPKK
jgi:hypothetical protein